MRLRTLALLSATALTGPGLPALGSDLHIQLPGSGTFTHNKVQFTCDGKASTMGLPSGTFTVEYINGAGNSLAVLPVGGKSLIFSSVISGSGARYAAEKYTWSDGGVMRGAFLSSDLNDPNAMTLCKQVK